MNRFYRVFTAMACAIATLAAFCLGAGSASAGSTSVRQSAIQLALSNSGPRGAHDFRVGEMVLDIPLLWANAATLREEVSVQTDEGIARLAVGTVLPTQMLAESGGAPFRAYCTPRRAAERSSDRGIGGALPALGWFARRLIRSATDRQLCLVDSDLDGRADQSIVVGDGPPEARTPRAIAPVAMDIGDLIPISGNNRVQIELTKVGRDSAELTLHIVQEGQRRVFSEVSGQWGRSSRVTRIRLDHGTVRQTNIFGAEFTLLAVDQGNRNARIGWPENADPREFAIVPDALDVRYGP
ncbi:MAG TPA: hypothetical protein VIT38_06140 [Allosphingosinicella sp.]